MGMWARFFLEGNATISAVTVSHVDVVHNSTRDFLEGNATVWHIYKVVFVLTQTHVDKPHEKNTLRNPL